MKILIAVTLLIFAAYGGFLFGRHQTQALASNSAPALQTAPKLEASGKPELAAPAKATSAEKPSAAVPISNLARMPSPLSAEWVHAARDVDRRFGVLYRICALNPKEHELVRELLTRESILRSRQTELEKQGVGADDIAAALAAEHSHVADLQNRLNGEMPEVAELISEFKARPFAAATTSDVAERIMIETGSMSPTQMEAIFSAASVAELQHPVPGFVNELSFDGRDKAALAVAANSLLERNKAFIPAACNVLEPDQVDAFMSYMEEQLLAVRNQAKVQ